MRESILILGGDGYLGWPTAMYLSNKGYDVTVIDNYLKKKNSKKFNISPLNHTPSLIQRAKIWYNHTGKEIKVLIADVSKEETLNNYLQGKSIFNFKINHKYNKIPNAIVHYAEQPSAPLSMLSQRDSNQTLINNIITTNNLIQAIKNYSPETHLIKLGTMGEYGTPNIDIEEGWLEIKHNKRKDTFLFPRQASSIYHTSKIMDTDLLWFAVRMWKLKVTDLMQGPVYGFETDESLIDSRLNTSFYYDEIFGTVINRFVVQSICNYPLTIYGKGGQTRGYLNLKDTLQCIHKSILNSPKAGQMKIYNQIMETFSVNKIASMIQKAGFDSGINVKIKKIKNPRIEKEEHYYNPKYQSLLKLGVKPNYLTQDTLKSFFIYALKYKKNINKKIIFNGINW